MNRLSSILIILTLLSGCAPVVLGAAATTGAVVANKEQSAGTTVDDAAIWTKIKTAFLETKNGDLFANVNVKVDEGRVLLTGSVPNAQVKLDSVRIAWEQPGVIEVINEVKVSKHANKVDIAEYSKDSWITTQIKTKLLLEKHVKSVNYNVETIDGVVYLIGIALNQRELDTVTHIARTIPHVKKVVSYVRLKSSPLRK